MGTLVRACDEILMPRSIAATTVNADAYKAGASTVLDACTEATDDYAGDTEEPADDPTEEPTEPTEEPEPENSLSVAQQNAVDMATSYLDNQSFSRKGLIKQLKFEGYSTEDSEFAVEYLQDNNQVNWNEQAAKTAQNYLDNQSFSRKGLIEQLEFEGFTREQAVYGVNEVGL